MKVYCGKIITCDCKNTVAKYLAEDGGKIVFVGDELPEKYEQAEKITLEGALVPSFADTHIHFASFATFHSGLNVMEAGSNAEILDMLRKYLAEHKESFIVGFGASPYSVSDGHLVTKDELDSVCPDKPVFIVKYDGHACVINSALLKKLENKISHLRGYHPDTGEMNQEAFFAVSDYVTNSISPIKLVKKMQKSGAKAYLVNTGWNGTGKRISIKDTRGIIDAILSGDIDKAPTKKIPYFNFEVPTELPGVDSGILDPRDTYADTSVWETKALDLAGRFIKNFSKYEGNEAGKALVSAGPQK